MKNLYYVLGTSEQPSAGQWTTENPKLTGPADHAFWMASMVFDGARSFYANGRCVAPDLDRHCERLINSARKMLMSPKLTASHVQQLCIEGIKQFAPGTALYLKPMFYGTGGFLLPDAQLTNFVLHIFDAPLPDQAGFSATLSPFRRSDADMAPTDAKASCLYPNGQRAIQEAASRGFENAVMLDSQGNVSEFATANIIIVKNGRAKTPVPNGTFLNGITRQRVIRLLNTQGITIEECSLKPEDLLTADEVFSVGNYGKVVHVNRFEDRALPLGPVAQRAHQAYFEWAASQAI